MAECAYRKPPCELGRELPDREYFLTLSQLQERLDEWKEEYNEERPHSACAGLPPS